MRSIVKAPSLSRHVHSLVDVATKAGDGVRWQEGVTFTPNGCQIIFGHDAVCWTGRGNKSEQDCVPAAIFIPYVLEATVVWATGDLAADPEALIVAAMDVGTSATLERLTALGIADSTADPLPIADVSGVVSSTGIVGRANDSVPITPPMLSQGWDIASAPVTASYALAVGLLETKLVDASDHVGGAGTIYMPPYVAAGAGDALMMNDGQLVTRATGSIVVVGNFGNAVYGHTGEVEVYLDDIIVTSYLDRAANEMTFQAERLAMAVWNPCATFKFAVEPPDFALP